MGGIASVRDDEQTRPGAADGGRLGPWYCGPPGKRRTYRVDDIEGIQGGQGLVVRARRATSPGDPVGWAGATSLKLTTGDDRPDLAVMRERWARLATVRHPSLARAVEVFEGPGLFSGSAPPDGDDDVLYQAAEWVEGVGLRDVVPLAPANVSRLARDLAGGLAALHAARLVHRDIHPGNVVVGGDGRAVLIDLGSVRPDDGGCTVTVAGALGFIAPEALHGADGRAAADRWGLGMTVVYALLGRPRGGVPRARLRADLAGALAAAGAPRPRRAARLIDHMLAPDPADRPTDPVRWAARLDRCVTPRPPSRRRTTAALAAGAGGTILATGAVAANQPAAMAPALAAAVAGALLAGTRLRHPTVPTAPAPAAPEPTDTATPSGHVNWWSDPPSPTPRPGGTTAADVSTARTRRRRERRTGAGRTRGAWPRLTSLRGRRPAPKGPTGGAWPGLAALLRRRPAPHGRIAAAGVPLTDGRAPTARVAWRREPGAYPAERAPAARAEWRRRATRAAAASAPSAAERGLARPPRRQAGPRAWWRWVAVGVAVAIVVVVGVGRWGVGGASHATAREFVCRPAGVPGACAAGAASRFGRAQVQPIARPGGAPDGVVVVAPGAAPAHLTAAEWASYLAIGGGSAGRAAARAGYPKPPKVGLVHVRVQLSGGGLLLGRRADTRMFWLPALAVGLWRRHGAVTGDLGLPTSDPYRVGPELHLDFEGGEMRAHADDLDALLAGGNSPGMVGVSTFTAAARGARLGVPAPAGMVLRQQDGTTWWVDDQGRRHWVADGPTGACYTHSSLARDHLPGWAVASLPLGAPVRCP